MFELTKLRDEGPMTFAEPNQADGLASTLKTIDRFNPNAALPRAGIELFKNPDAYKAVFESAERQQRLVDNVFARDRATEEAFDQRIKAIKDATGIELENPVRGGYAIEARKAVRDEVRANAMQTIDAKGGIPEFQQRIFEQRLEQLRQQHPDKIEALTFGDLGTQAQTIARGSEEDAKKAGAAATDPIASFGASVAGSLWAGRRDPLFLGSLFVGPTTAVGKTVLSRIVDAGIRQGLFNAGVSALEQPTVQDWRREIGVRSGLEPALENIGLAFILGAIPGAAFRGVHEAVKVKPAIDRTLAGHPEPGDAELAVRAAGAGMEPHEAAAVRMGEDMLDADRALLPPPAKNVTPEIHDDMTAAALKFADDPVNSPAPEAVELVNQIRAYHGSAADFDAFDSAKIGTGEGAQVRAYGLYFAEDKAVAKTYRDKLSAKAGGTNGVVYDVAIRRPREDFLEWETDLTAQPAGKKILERMDPEFKERLNEYLDDHGQPEVDELTGGMFLRLLERYASEDGLPGVSTEGFPRKEAAEYVASLDIPGVRFLDQKSRSNGAFGDLDAAPNSVEATRNIVVFNDKDIQITHKNGVAVGAEPNRSLMARIEAEQPKSQAEAVMAASRVLEEDGTKATVTRLREEIESDRRVPTMVEDRGNGNFFILDQQHPTNILSLRVTDDAVQVGIATVDKADRGQGIGTAMYERAIAFAQGQDLPLRSDMSVSAAAVRIYRSLERRGYDVREAPNSGSSKAGMTNATEGYVFEVRPPKPLPASDALSKIPFVRDDGTPVMLTRGAAAKIGEKESNFAMLVRSCK